MASASGDQKAGSSSAGAGKIDLDLVTTEALGEVRERVVHGVDEQPIGSVLGGRRGRFGAGSLRRPRG